MEHPEFIILVGSGRSGTTYLTNLFFNALDVGLWTEPKFVAQMHRRRERFGDLERPENLRRVATEIHATAFFRDLDTVKDIATTPEEIVERVQERTIAGVLLAAFQLVADKRGKSRLGYKDPSDVVNLALLAQLFPSARFVHILRDGRDVALSMMKFNWGPTNPYAGARHWAQVTRQGRADGARLGERYFELTLEDLINDTESVAPALGRFVTGGTCPDQVDAFVAQVLETRNPGMIDAWRHKLDAHQRYLCECGAGGLLEELGYETEFGPNARLSAPSAAYHMASDLVVRLRNKLRTEEELPR